MSSEFDISELEAFRDKLEKLSKNTDKIARTIIEDIALRTLRATDKRTPVGVYTVGRTGGTLRKGWYVTDVVKVGGSYEVYLKNDTNYASFVEYGHRTRGHKSWVDGRFMMTISVDEVDRKVEQIQQATLERMIRKELGL